MLQAWSTILPLSVLLVLCCRNAESRNDQCVLIFLIDGVRWDYIERDSENLSGFRRIAKAGVMAKYVRPIYPSNSYPNWYSITTGLYAESHGMVGNYIYDPLYDEFFSSSSEGGGLDAKWWNDAEPIWITAVRNGIRTSMSNWIGCEVRIRGHVPTYCDKYQAPSILWPVYGMRLEEAAMVTLDRFQKKQVRLGMVYHEIVDTVGHSFGPDSIITKRAVQAVDRILTRVQDEIEERGLADKVNVIVVSDHGMTSKSILRSKTVSLDDVVPPDDIKVMLGANYNAMIWPMAGKEEVVYSKLVNAKKPGLHVYKKKDVPTAYHYKNHRMIAPIVLRTDKDYIILPLKSREKSKPNFPTSIIGAYLPPGVHGFDPYSDDMTDMRTIFLARGPGLKKGVTALPLEMVDHYNVFCHLLGIPPVPNNGSWHRVRGFLQNT